MSLSDPSVSRRLVLSVGVAGAAYAAGSRLLGAQEGRAATPERIARAKQRLNDQGYWCGAVNGTIDDLTICAMLAYQKARGRAADGVLDYNAMAALTQAHDPPRFTAVGRVVEVDVKRQLLRVVSNGQVLLTLHASTGHGGVDTFGTRAVLARTPRGRFRIRKASAGTVATSLGPLHRPHFFLDAYAVYGRADLASLRRPSTTGAVAVHSKALPVLENAGHLNQGRLVVVG